MRWNEPEPKKTSKSLNYHLFARFCTALIKHSITDTHQLRIIKKRLKTCLCVLQSINVWTKHCTIGHWQRLTVIILIAALKLDWNLCIFVHGVDVFTTFRCNEIALELCHATIGDQQQHSGQSCLAREKQLSEAQKRARETFWLRWMPSLIRWPWRTCRSKFQNN